MIRKLEVLYNQINSKGKAAVLNSVERVDPMLHRLNYDKRRGLSLLIKIPDDIAKHIQTVQNEIWRIEPDQYFYPKEDLHLTTLTFISASEDFQLSKDLIEKYKQLIQKAVNGLRPFSIKYQGIILSEDAVMAKGYYKQGLQYLRDTIRKNALENSIVLNERYQSISAHSTIIRFRANLKNKKEFLSLIDKYRNYNFGILNVSELNLVIHDWYNSKKEMDIKFNI